MGNNSPNVLFIFTDDQRFDALGMFNPAIHTPHLDALAARGTTFTHAHIPGGTSAAVCMPSRAMLHTGRTLFHLENEGQTIPEAHTMLGECLQSAGYNCYGIGKWHNGRRAFARSFNGGAEIFFGGMDDHWNVPAYHFDPTGQYEQQHCFVRDPKVSNQLEWRNCDHIVHGTHSTDLFCDAASSFLNTQSNDSPFFLYVSLMAPHDPRTMPQEFLELYNPDEIELPPNFAERHAFDFGISSIRDEVLADDPRQPKEIKRHLAEYYAMISHLDAQFGDVVRALEENQLADNTIIVFAGDNGLALGQHGLMGKQNLYDHSVRVPLIFAGPGIQSGEQRDTLCYLSDIYPTLCDLIGIDSPPSVEGTSLVSCLANDEYQIHDALYLAYTDKIRGIRQNDFKLMVYANGESQLFNVADDAYETNNLIADVAMRPTLQEMRQSLLRFRNEWDDQLHPHGRAFWEQFD